MIFGNERNSDILADFLLSVLDIPGGKIDRVTILNPNLEPDTPEDKQSILDLKVQLDGARSVNVEIHILEIPKLGQDGSNPALVGWLRFLNARDKEELV